MKIFGDVTELWKIKVFQPDGLEYPLSICHQSSQIVQPQPQEKSEENLF